MSEGPHGFAMPDGPRGLLTERERDVVRGDEDVDEDTQSTLLSRVRGKISALGTDGRLLRQYRPEIYREAYEAFCVEDVDERIDRLEQEAEEQRERIELLEDEVARLKDERSG